MTAMSSRAITTVAVLGPGAMGGLYAAHFAAAGFPVLLPARGERATRLRERGLTVNGSRVPATVVDADEPADPAPVDLALVAVKYTVLTDALADLAPLVGPDTVVLSVLNGLRSEEVIDARFGAGHALPCMAMAMDAERVGDEVTYTQSGRLVFGEVSGPVASPRVLRVQEALDRAGLAWLTPADMRREMWWKFMVNVGINQASAVLRAPYGAFRAQGDARSLMRALMDEAIAVANAEGVDLGPADLQRWDDVLAGQPDEGRTSMHQDVEAGRGTEVEIFAGEIVALGRRHGIPTPVNEVVRWVLRAGAARHGGASDRG